MERELVTAVGERAVLDPCDAGAGQLRSPHHLEDPPDLLADHDGGDALALDRAHDLGGAGGPVVDRHQVHRTGAGERDLDQPAARAGGAVHHDGRRRWRVDRGRQLPERVTGEGVADVTRLLVAHAHRLDDLVGAARARRVVRAVEDQLAPPDVEERGGILRGREEQRAQGFGDALEAALGARRGLVHVDAVRRHAHQHVRPRARPQLTAPRRQAVDRLLTHVLPERRDREAEVVLQHVGFRDHPPEPRLGRQVVGAVHQEHAAAGQRRPPQLGLVASGACDEARRVGGDVAAVGVGAVEVLGAHLGAVGGAPPERGAGDVAGHAPPDHRVFEAGEAQDLRHLRDVAEHVGEVADPHGGVAAQGLGASQAVLQVADRGLTRDHEFVHEDHPRPHLEPAGGGERGEAGGRVGPYRQVVVDDRGLAVEEEPGERGVGFQQLQQVVDQVHELHPVLLEGGVPLPVPVRVGDDADRGHGGQDTSRPSRYRSSGTRCPAR